MFEKPISNSFIYALICPDTNIVRYVGLTTIGITRIRQHSKDFKKNKSGKLIKIKSWVKKLRNNNKMFKVKYLEYCDNRDVLIEREKYWIKQYKSEFLLNHTEGGYLPSKKKLTQEEKDILSKKIKALMQTPEIRKKYLIGYYTKRVVPKTYKKWSDKSKTNVSNSSYHTSKKVKLKDNNGILYESLMDCAKKLNVTKQALSRHLAGKLKRIKGLTFERVF